MSQLVEKLAIETGLGFWDIRRIAARAPVRYKVYRIPKRGGGTRIISQPAPEVKLLQRALVTTVLSSLPIHASATAYRSGMSIAHNAIPHASNGPILKLDLKEFFPSLRAIDWIIYCRKTNCLTDEDAHLSANILFSRSSKHRGLRLAIGAPSSPPLSNILMHEFDTLVSTCVGQDYVTYTRYADDMTFSALRTGFLTHVKSNVCKIIRDLRYPTLDINDSKTTYVTKKYHRAITGLTISNDGRVTIGREKKRKISATMHRATQGNLTPPELQVLSGLLAYVNAVEPQFLDRLREKYGEQIVKSVQHFVIRGQQPINKQPSAPS